MNEIDSALGPEYWDRLFGREDPWNYRSPYERQKYAHTLEMIPRGPHRTALEIGCAEGMFTEMLSPLVDSLLALDISGTALERARERCAGQAGVSFSQHDIRNGLPGGSFDLIVCSEVLYYLKDGAAVKSFAARLSAALAEGGRAILTHANMVTDDRSRTGFDFNEIGAGFIGESFAGIPELCFEAELQTELYRVQVFRKRPGASRPVRSEGTQAGEPRERLLRVHAPFEHRSIKWGGCLVTDAEARHLWRTPRIPVLMYHRIADDGPEALAPYRVDPRDFERQLAFLQRHGYHSISMAEYERLWFQQGLRQLPGKPVVLTFDDAYEDFYEDALPLLRHYGFSATVFVPVGFVGGGADWDRESGPPARVMDWDRLERLARQGIEIGAHGFSHVRPWEMSEEEFRRDTVRARERLESRLGMAVEGYCYPYASGPEHCQKIVADSGFRYAAGGWGKVDLENPFMIPRIEVFGGWSIDDFAASLPAPVPADAADIARFEEWRARRDRATYMNA